jgi:hypothetical protein
MGEGTINALSEEHNDPAQLEKGFYSNTKSLITPDTKSAFI